MEEKVIVPKAGRTRFAFWDELLETGAVVVGGLGLANEFKKWFDNRRKTSLGPTYAAATATPTAEEKVAEFGKGWGDEQQDLDLRKKLSPSTRRTWEEFLSAHYTGRKGGFQERQERQALTGLRQCLTSWDKAPGPIGWTETKVTGKPQTIKTGEKIVSRTQVADIFGKTTTHAVEFIEDCAKFITDSRDERLKQCAGSQTPIPALRMQSLTTFSTEYAHVQLVKKFRSVGLPTMPLPEEKSWERSVDEGIKNLEGLPHEIINDTHSWLLARKNARIGLRQTAKASGLSISRLLWRLVFCAVAIAAIVFLVYAAIQQPSQTL